MYQAGQRVILKGSIDPSQVSGSTAQTVAANPNGRLEPRTIVFPPTLCGEPAYQHAILHNDGEVPLLFEVNAALLPSTVICKPKRLNPLLPRKDAKPKGYTCSSHA